MELVSAGANYQRLEFTPIFSDIQEMSLSFSSFSVVHARRSANKAAHVCASFAEHAFDVWANAPPNFLLQVLQDDCDHFDEWMKKLIPKKKKSVEQSLGDWRYI